MRHSEDSAGGAFGGPATERGAGGTAAGAQWAARRAAPAPETHRDRMPHLPLWLMERNLQC